MRILGAILLTLGIMLLIASSPGATKPILPFWAGGIGGFMVGFSYALSWRE